MRTRNRRLVFTLVPALAASLALPAAARDREFSAAIHHIERTYHVHPNHRFLMWSVGMIVKVAHPEGVRSLFAPMQTVVPGLTDLKDETAGTQQLYGLDSKFQHTASFARQCLLARRQVERGVRFIELKPPRSTER